MFTSRKIEEKSPPFLKEKSLKTSKPKVFFGPEINSFPKRKPLFSKNLFIYLIIVFVIFFYIFLGIKNLFSPPEIIVYFPPHQWVTQEKTIIIKGKVKGEAMVFINNQPVALRENVFEEKIVLSSGINTIKISARKKFSPERVIFRQIIVK
ncbi:MAG: hypothetical protein ACK413_02440 [Patescibacteria group bacterium]